MEINEVLKLADLFYKMSQVPQVPQMRPQSIDKIRNAIKNKYGNPPMNWINSLSENTYNKGGSCDLVIYLENGKPTAKFVKSPMSVDNPGLLVELNAKIPKEIIASFGKQINEVIEYEKKTDPNWSDALFNITLKQYPAIGNL